MTDINHKILVGQAWLRVRGYSQNGDCNLKQDQILCMLKELGNKWDNDATLVKTLDGKIVGRVPRLLSTDARKMMQDAADFGAKLHLTFIQLHEVEVKDRRGKRYLEEQPEIQVDFRVKRKLTKTDRACFYELSRTWKDFHYVEADDEDFEEKEPKRGDHVGFGNIIGDSGDEIEGGSDLPPRKRLK